MTSWTEFLVGRGALFDGEMVKSFGDREAELAAARDGVVVCDLAPLRALSVSGPDAAQFLHGQLTSDVLALAHGTWQFAAWCSPKGRMLANFVVRRSEDQRFELLLAGGLLEIVRKRLGMFVLRSKVTIEDASAASVRVGVGGPRAAAAIRAVWGESPAGRQAMSAQGVVIIGLPGTRWMAWVEPERAAGVWDRLAAVARPGGFSTWEWLSIRAGVPLITPASSDQYLPQMANWDALDGVSFDKGCYSGQEIVARMRYLGRLKERLVLAHVDAPPPASGERIFNASSGDQACGSVVNAAEAPGGGVDLLAVLRLDARDGGELRLGSLDGPALALLPLPYAIPEIAASRNRIA